MNELISLFLVGILANNILFSKFIDIENLLKIVDRKDLVVNFSKTIIISCILSSILSYYLYTMILVPFNLVHLRILLFILISLLSVYILKPIYKNDELFKILAVNAVLLQVLIDNLSNSYNIGQVIVNSLSSSLGFVIMVYIYIAINERLSFANLPKGFKGLPILLIVSGLIALALSGLSGI